MNNELITTTTNSDNVKAVYFNESELHVIHQCLTHCSNQVFDSDNNVEILDCGMMNMSYQQQIIDEVVSAVEIPLLNFDDLDTFDDVQQRAKMMLEDNNNDFDDEALALQQNINKYNKIIDDCKEQITTITNMQMKVDDDFLYDSYQQLLDTLYCRLHSAEDNLQQNKIIINMNKSKKQANKLKAVYSEISNVVNQANEEFDSNNDAYDRTMFTIACNDKKFDIDIYATAYESVCTMLEIIYEECLDGDKRDLR